MIFRVNMIEPIFRKIMRNIFGFSITSLFNNAEQGFWLEPSDLTTMFFDRAGTTPVTTPGTLVGRRLDKSGNGNHLIANSDAARGIYGIEPFGGRRNLLTWSEDFSNAVWVKDTATISTNSAVAPDGTTTADTITGVSGSFRAYQTVTALVSGATYTMSAYVKQGTSPTIRLDFVNVAAGPVFTFSTASWSVVSGFTTTVQDVGSGWLRIAATYVSNTTNAGPGWSVSGTTTALIWGAQLELGSTATSYQRVGTQYDVTEAGKPTLHYVQYDGSNDGYVSPTITPGIDKAQVFVGLRKLSDVARGSVAELSTTIASNNGALQLTAPNAASATYAFESKGTTLRDAVATPFTAPLTSVVVGLGDIAGNSAIIRVNGAQLDADTGNQGTGNYLAAPVYVGSRSGSSLFFNGRDYGIIMRFGPNLDAEIIRQAEAYIAGKTGVIL